MHAAEPDATRMVRWLLRRSTRAARLAILRARFRALWEGDSVQGVLVVALYAGFLTVAALPGETTKTGDQWRVARDYLGGDRGMVISSAVLLLLTLIALLDLVEEFGQRISWLASTIFLAALGASWSYSAPLSVAPVMALVLTGLSLWAYLRVDRV